MIKNLLASNLGLESGDNFTLRGDEYLCDGYKKIQLIYNIVDCGFVIQCWKRW